MKVTRLIPNSLKDCVPEAWKFRIRNGIWLQKDHSDVQNIYHCCTHRSASQWMRGLLKDPITFQYTGLTPFHYQTEWMNGYDSRPYDERSFDRQFPTQTIVSPLYIDYKKFKEIKKPDKYRAFFILRDPRDVVVSWYFSTKYSHQLMGPIKRHRENLKELSDEEGLCYGIERLSNFGLFDAQLSWIKNQDDTNVTVLKYEKITGDKKFAQIKHLFHKCNIDMPDKKIKRVLEKHRFSNKSQGRGKGEEDKNSHYRKGKKGDWRNYFTENINEKFKNETGNIIEELGYKK